MHLLFIALVLSCQRVEPLFANKFVDSFEPLLFMTMEDVKQSWGLVYPVANTVAANSSFKPPPVNFSQGDLVIAVISSATVPGLFEVYAENTTGIEPLNSKKGSQIKLGDNPTNATTSQLLRFTTRDFISYSPAIVVLSLNKGGTPTMKSMARSDDGLLYVLFTVYNTFSSFGSRDGGLTWIQLNTTGVVKPDKDDLNLIFNQGRFVDMQIVKQKVAFP